jgi:predicted phage terminase large subunit-like protein
MTLTPDLAHEGRLALTKQAREDLMAYVLSNDHTYIPSKIHVYLCEKLQKLIETEGERRLIINMPPQHGKSRLVAEEFASFLLGKDPTQNIVIAGYNTELPIKNSKAIRRRFESDAYRAIFPNSKMSDDTRTANNWTTTKNGGIRAVGLGAGLTGNRASTLIIDDPHKDRAAAESMTSREHVWDWYQSVAMTRLTPDSIVIIIMTRWHEDDLVGRLTTDDYISSLEDKGFKNQVYEHLNFPAICEDELNDNLKRKEGEVLWPENKDRDFIEARKVMLTPYEYNSLYKGEPVSKGGNIVDINMLTFIDAQDVPPSIEKVRAWDLAITTKQTSDYTASALCAYDKQTEIFYILNVFRKRMNWHEIKRTIQRYADLEDNRVGIESVSGFIAAYEEIKEERLGKNIVVPLTPKGDKLTRANPWLAKVEAGKVLIVKSIWNYDFIEELRTFPDGKHDDQIDSVTLCWNMLYKKSRLLLA